ncbi:MAG: hypothetical protein ACRC62_05390 [Microcoleus sp.]
MKSLRPAIVMSDADYINWLNSIGSEQQICLLQEFHPASDMILDINKEYWSYKYFRVHRDKNGKLHGWEGFEPQPLREDGRCCYYGGEDSGDNKHLCGKVFAARIVPLHHEILPTRTWDEIRDLPARNGFTETEIPLYEPKWCGDRVFLMSEAPHLKSKSLLLDKFLGYSKKINEGHLLTLFPGEHESIYDFQEWWEKNKEQYPGWRFLYSEPVNP